MASRILTCVSCTFYFCLLIIITIVGFASLIIGAVGVGLYVPTSKNYDDYKINNCTIIDVEYDTCIDSCYYVMWSVEYPVLYGQIKLYTFSTITKTYDTLSTVTKEVGFYANKTTHTCYYDQTNTALVQWPRPSSPKPYLIMMIVGFGLTTIYLCLISIFYVFRIYDPQQIP